ncbi:hypothetical protein Pla110_05640 [Polystyrenella longa]|uniref:Uncharacterized protein n=1 Tax=Polystyrenella longa TaxID=2528007 RepID=A0A518CI05_9PLAN|nr:hypothetical protein Pla110_05640 [Polystyrenella longa]
MPRWNRFGRVGACLALVVSVAGCYSYPYNPYAPNGPGVPPTYSQPGPAFPQNGTYMQPGPTYVQPPSGPAAYSPAPGSTTNLSSPPSSTGFEPVPATNGSGGTNSNDAVPDPWDQQNNNGTKSDPFGEQSSTGGAPTGGASDPFKLAIVGTPSSRPIAQTIR